MTLLAVQNLSVAYGDLFAVSHAEVLYSEQRHFSAFCLVPR